MRTVLVLLASLLLSSQAYAGACFVNGVKIDSCQGSDCCEGEWDDGNGNGGSGTGVGVGVGVGIGIGGGADVDVTTGDNTNTTTIGDVSGGAGGDGGNVTVGDTSLSTGDVNVSFGGGEGGEGSFNTDVDNTNRLVGGDQTTTVGDTTATVGDVSGGSINIHGGGEEGGDAPFSVNSDIDNDNVNRNNNTLNGGDSIARSNSSTTIGDTTLNNDSNSTSGAAIIIGGGYGNGECYDDECGGGDAPFTNTNDVDIDNNSTATTGDQITNVDNTDNSFNGGNTLIVGGQGEEGEGGGTLNSNAENTVDVANDNTSTAVNEGNNTDVNVEVTVEGQDVPTANSQTVEGDEINVDARTINEASTVKPAVNSVAPSFSGICNSGAAGQGRGFALSLAVTNDVCQCLMMADAYMALGDVEEAHKWVHAAARHAKAKGGVGYIRHFVTLGIL